MEMFIYRKGRVYSCDCAKCGTTYYIHEWTTDDFNNDRDAMQAGNARCQARTTATRRGSKNGGITTTAASWRGAIRVELYVDDKGRDCYRVYQTTWQGAGIDKSIAEGVIGEPRSACALQVRNLSQNAIGNTPAWRTYTQGARARGSDTQPGRTQK